ncbi:hypothetical protein TNCV_4674831 [Trichonephila clavipes]|nr:hypothetical protein TNCV_4674831 [Trichonephila clavipes]
MYPEPYWVHIYYPGCHWGMEREAFLHPISRLLMWPDVCVWLGLPEREWDHGKAAWLLEQSCSSPRFRRECPEDI